MQYFKHLPWSHFLGSFIILQFISQTNVLGQIKVDNCQGDCKPLGLCAAIARNFAAWQAKIPFCDQANSIVCCPNAGKAPNRHLYSAVKSKIYVRECLNYRNQVYKNCDALPLILQGEKAEPKELPHMARIGVRYNDGKYNWVCGGTLISPVYVLTAAHCFFGKEIPNHVRLGDLDFSTDNDDAQPQDFTIERYIVHPQYDFTQKYNDVALIELSKEATLNEYVVPACLPLSNGTEYSHFTAAGWGATIRELSSEHLLKVELDRFDEEQCKEVHPIDDNLERGLLVRTQICAGSKTDRRDTCQGDSGGPLFVHHPEYPCMFLVMGVTSFGIACGIKNAPGVYMRMKLYVDWVENIVWNATTSI